MGRKLERIKIAGAVFIIKSKTVEEPHYNTTPWNTLKMLGDCYDKPSSDKVAINRDWIQWTYDVNYNGIAGIDATILAFGIRSYNNFSFNYGGMILIDDVRYVIDITPSHNFLWKIA